MNLLSIETVVLLGLSVVGFFLKDLFSRFGKLEAKVENNISKYNTEFGKLIGRLNTIDTRATGELKRLEEMMDIHFKNQSDKLEELQRMLERINTNR